MSVPLTNTLLTAIQNTKLLSAVQWGELTAWVAQTNPEPLAVVKEIRSKRWLTDFQIKEISRGRGQQLTLGPYFLLDLLGEGGMGRVFKARHTRLARDVALKVIRKEKLSKPAVIQRFHQEIRAAAQLSHPNVVMAFDADEVDGVHYFAMEYVEGSDLTKVVRDHGPIPIPQGCDYIRQAAIGLQHAHERGLVHRDVKPSNLLLTPKGQVKILDLGLAMLNNDPAGDDINRVTHAGLVLGTPDFLAPEQAQNPLGVDIRADVYALGATLFYILTGKVPFEGPTPTDKLIQHITAPPPSLLQHIPDAPPHLEAVIKWLMAKRPQDRPQTPAEVAYALVPFCPPGINLGPTVAPIEVIAVRPVMTYASPVLSAQQANQSVAPNSTPFDQFTVSYPNPSTATTRRRSRKPKNRFPKRALIVGALAFFAVAGIAAISAVINQQYASALPPLPDKFTNAQSMTLVQLLGGTYTMGSMPSEIGHQPNEAPDGPVTVSGPFFMSTTEVTQSQYIQVMGRSPAKWAPKLRKSKEAQAPVDSVTWEEATEFCKKLSLIDRKRREGWGYRLPTEAEWEYACRAGGSEPFSSGNKLIYGKSAIFNMDKEQDEKGTLGEEDTSKAKLERMMPYLVASTEPNAFGLYDMHGNVWEWCHDVYAPDYRERSALDPKGPVQGELRVLRGGSWREAAALCRSAARRGANPDTRGEDVGFRVVYAPN